jgi:hypothetical protein
MKESWFDSQQRQEISVFSAASRLVQKPIQPPVQWLLAAISPGVKRPGHEADHSNRFNARVNNM